MTVARMATKTAWTAADSDSQCGSFLPGRRGERVERRLVGPERSARLGAAAWALRRRRTGLAARHGRCGAWGRPRIPRHRWSSGKTAQTVRSGSGCSQEGRDAVQGVVEDRLEACARAAGTSPAPRSAEQPDGRRRRSIRANGSDSPDSSRTGQRMAGQWAIRASVRSGRAGRMERIAEAARAPRTARPARRRRGSRPGRRTSGRRPRRRARTGPRGGTRAGRPRPCASAGRWRVASTPRAAETLDERRHAGGRPARAVAQEQRGTHREKRSLAWAVRMAASWSGSGHGRSPDAAAILGHAPLGRSHADRRSSAAAVAPDPRRSRSALIARGASRSPIPATALRSRAAGRPDADGPVPAPPATADRPRRHRHVLRPRLRPRRRDVPVRRTRPRARRPGRARRSSPTTTGRDPRDDRPDHADPRPGPRRFAATTAKPLVLYGRRRPWTIDGIARIFPPDAKLRLIPTTTTTAGIDRRPGGSGSRRATGAVLLNVPAPATIVDPRGAAPRPAAAVLEADRLRPVSRRPAARPATTGPTVSVVNEHRARDLPARGRAGRDALDLADGGAQGAGHRLALVCRSATAPRRLLLRHHRRHRARRSTAAPRPSERRRTSPSRRPRPAGRAAERHRSIANTLYHSTGGGATEDNENVFVSPPGQMVAGPVSYLRGSMDRRDDGTAYDDAAPYATWSMQTRTRGRSCRPGSRRMRGRTSATLQSRWTSPSAASPAGSSA